MVSLSGRNEMTVTRPIRGMQVGFHDENTYVYSLFIRNTVHTQYFLLN